MRLKVMLSAVGSSNTYPICMLKCSVKSSLTTHPYLHIFLISLSAPFQDEAYDYFTKHGTYPVPEYHKPITSWWLWKMRLNILFWGILLFVVPCLLIYLYLSWAYIIFLSLLALLCEWSAILLFLCDLA